MSSRETLVCGKEEKQSKGHVSESSSKSHVPLTEDEARTAEAARQSALDILRDALKKKDRVLMETPRDLISRDSEQPQLWMERFAILTEQRVRDLISVLEEARFMGDPSTEKIYAYVYLESGDKTIYLCPPFWEAPSHLDIGSQPGTLIHEASHFLGARDITYLPVGISVACTGQIVKNSSTDPNSPDYVPLVNAVLNASNIDSEFEVTLRHKGRYERGRYSCCGETARSSVCERALPDKFFTSPNKGSESSGSSIGQMLGKRLKPARDRLKRHVAALRALADAVDEIHRGATIANVAGGTMGIVGGVTTLVGLGLTPLTFGASLAVSLVGLGVSAAGGVTSAVATTTDIVQGRVKKEEINGLLDQCQAELQLIQECMEHISVQVQKATGDSIKSDPLLAIPQIGAGAGRAVFNAVKMVKAGKLLANTGRAARFAGFATRALTGFTVGLDVIFVAGDSIDLYNGAKTQLAAEIRLAVTNLQQVIDEVNDVEKVLTA